MHGTRNVRAVMGLDFYQMSTYRHGMIKNGMHDMKHDRHENKWTRHYSFDTFSSSKLYLINLL